MRGATQSALHHFSFLEDAGFKPSVWEPVGEGVVIRYERDDIEIAVDVNQRYQQVYVTLDLDGVLNPQAGLGLWEILEVRVPEETAYEETVEWERSAVDAHIRSISGLVRTHCADVLAGDLSFVQSVLDKRPPSPTETSA